MKKSGRVFISVGDGRKKNTHREKHTRRAAPLISPDGGEEKHVYSPDEEDEEEGQRRRRGRARGGAEEEEEGQRRNGGGGGGPEEERRSSSSSGSNRRRKEKKKNIRNTSNIHQSQTFSRSKRSKSQFLKEQLKESKMDGLGSMDVTHLLAYISLTSASIH